MYDSLFLHQALTSKNTWPSHYKQEQERFSDPSCLKRKLCLIIHGRLGSPLWSVQLDRDKGSLEAQEKAATAGEVCAWSSNIHVLAICYPSFH